MFGNDNEATNEIAGEMFTFIANEIESYRSKFGTMTPGILPVSGNTPFGLEVGALPSGRHAWKPLADGVSPNGGTDTEGPGAVLKSVSHLPHDRFVQGTLLNMKIEPEMLNSENGIMHDGRLQGICAMNFPELGKDVQRDHCPDGKRNVYGFTCGRVRQCQGQEGCSG